MNIQHVFFDLDHTLWDFEKNSDLAFKKVFDKQNITIDLNVFLAVYKPLNLQLSETLVSLVLFITLPCGKF